MMEHISKHHADESLKAQQEAAATAAAQAAAAQAAAPAPLIKTLPSNKTLYATQTIATTPLISNTQPQQQIRLQPVAPTTTHLNNQPPPPQPTVISSIAGGSVGSVVASSVGVAGVPSHTTMTGAQVMADTTGAVQIVNSGMYVFNFV